MPEYSCDLPLWLCDWWDLDLPRNLLNDVADWQETFDANFDPDAGWSDSQTRDDWRGRADELIARLREAVPPGVEVKVDLWPIDPED